MNFNFLKFKFLFYPHVAVHSLVLSALRHVDFFILCQVFRSGFCAWNSRFLESLKFQSIFHFLQVPSWVMIVSFSWNWFFLAPLSLEFVVDKFNENRSSFSWNFLEVLMTTVLEFWHDRPIFIFSWEVVLQPLSANRGLYLCLGRYLQGLLWKIHLKA